MTTDEGPTITVRPARADDAAAVARVHVGAWLAAYRGLMPDEYLDGLDVHVAAERWARALADHQRPHPLLGAVDGDVAGFVTVGPDRQAGGDGELYALNVLPHAWGTGLGAALLRAGEDRLRHLGHRRGVLWVVPGNARARHFYEREGWVDDHGEQRATINGVTVDEVRYAKDLAPGADAERPTGAGLSPR